MSINAYKKMIANTFKKFERERRQDLLNRFARKERKMNANVFEKIAQAQKKVDMQSVLDRFASVMADVTGENIVMLKDGDHVIVKIGSKEHVFDVSANSDLATIRDIFEKCFM